MLYGCITWFSRQGNCEVFRKENIWTEERNETGLTGRMRKICCKKHHRLGRGGQNTLSDGHTIAAAPEECTKRRKICFTELSDSWEADGNLCGQ